MGFLNIFLIFTKCCIPKESLVIVSHSVEAQRNVLDFCRIQRKIISRVNDAGVMFILIKNVWENVQKVR